MESLIEKGVLSNAKRFHIRLTTAIRMMIATVICLICSASLFAASPVKPLSNKVLKTIEGKYDKETRKMFSGKGSEKNVLALKRLIAEEVNPDLAISAIRMYNQARSYRSGSKQRRAAIREMEVLFSSSNICWKKGRDIVIGASTAIAARKSRTVQNTYQNPNKPSCRSKRTVSKRAPKVKFQDSDRLAENVLLTKLRGNITHSLSPSLS
ncbi:MAG: hypothetical protein AAF587_09025 [Bacteroidota bacterium]